MPNNAVNASNTVRDGQWTRENPNYADIRVSTCNAASLVFTSTDCMLSAFHPISVDDVAAAVRPSPNKQSASDPWLLKE